MDGATKRPALSSFGAENGPACSKTALHRNSDAEPHGQTEINLRLQKNKSPDDSQCEWGEIARDLGGDRATSLPDGL